MSRRPKEDLLPLLVSASEDLLAEFGRREVTLRRVAERVTVMGRPITHTAAFAHVGGQLELLAHVSENWWNKLLDLLVQTGTGLEGPERLVALGLAYRGFAIEHPQQFRVMYEEEIWRQIETRIQPLDQVLAARRERVGESAPEPYSQRGSERAHRFHRPEVLQSIVYLRDKSLEQFIESALSGVRKGLLRNDKPAELLARSIASLSHGLAMEALDEGLASEAADPILELAVDGLRRSA